MRAGDYVLVQLSASAKRRTLARLLGYHSGLKVRIEVYRTSPERIEACEIPMAQLCGVAPESEKLTAFRSLEEMKAARQRRERARVSVNALAQVVGVSPHTLAAAESGKKKTQPRVRLWILEGLRRIEAKAAKSS